jgi:hypothetical protein
MTTTTGAIGLAAVQTEFGGANPISLSEYYRGGSLVAAGTAAGTSGVQIAASGAIRLGDFRGVSADGPVAAWDGSYVDYNRSGATATAGVVFQTDGSLTDYGVSASGSVLPGGSKWYSTITPGIGSSYWIRANGGSWVSLATAQSFGVSRATVGTTSTDFTFDIAATSGGAVLASGTINCTAERF